MEGGKRHEMPCHHNPESYLHECLDQAGIARDPKSWLFRMIERRYDVAKAPAPTGRAWDDPSARSCRWHCDPRRSSRVSRNWHHGVSQKRQRTHERGRYSGPCLYTHDATVFA
jgi:hypothetical protein